MSNFGSFIQRMLIHKAVYWQRTGPDGHGGSEYADPIEIDCRWDEIKELIQAENGREITSNAQVLVNQDMSENDMLYFGELSELDSDQEDDPDSAGAYRIKSFRKIASINGRFYKKMAYL